MAKGRQTKIVGRVSVTGTITELHGQHFLTWSVSRPCNLTPNDEGVVSGAVKTEYFSSYLQAVNAANTWLLEPGNVPALLNPEPPIKVA